MKVWHTILKCNLFIFFKALCFYYLPLEYSLIKLSFICLTTYNNNISKTNTVCWGRNSTYRIWEMIMRSNFMRSKFNFFRRSKFNLLLRSKFNLFMRLNLSNNINQAVDTSIMRSKPKQALLQISISWSLLWLTNRSWEWNSK
jgi:hypothetical protein